MALHHSKGRPVDQSSGTAAGGEQTEAGFLPTRPGRFVPESVLVRVIATIGVIAVGTVVGAILVANNVAGWITGLAVASVSVVLAAVLWRSRHM